MATAHAPLSGDGKDRSNSGIFWMLLTMFLFVSMDTIAKYLIQDHHVMQVAWGRYFFHLLVLLIVLAPRLRSLLVTKNLKLQLARSLLLLTTTICFFTGLNYVQLADASAIMLTAPVFVTALSMPILKEYVGPRRWASVIVGCIGAIIIIRPGSSALDPAALFPLTAAILYAFYQISTRFLSQSDSIFTTLIYSATIGAVILSLIVPFYWTPLSYPEWGLMLLLGVIGGTGHFTLIKAYTVSPVATVAPFTYSNLIWAVGYGYLVFGNLPDQWTVVGALIIMASGLYIFHREQIRKAR
ncbi:MAG: DMT family transporter [Rhodospirillales bacterium]|nr:DMT family transporter [Rhodospirillales bacterium]